MDVKVGHLQDPEDLQGLAHFCEHLMFMGTEKYPKENDYTEFLTQHSGSSNAFTGMDQTCYYFDVAPDALTPALDRFAQFFISPLFDESCTEREANAVNSENSKNLQSDMWRFFQLDKSTSSRKHAFWRFGTGNKETLWDGPKEKGVDVRARLIEWQEQNYSANLCKLVVLTKESLDDITKTVVDKFTPAPNRHLPPPEFPGSPYTRDELQRTLFVKSVRDVRTLELSFTFPDESAYYATKPGSFLSHLIGHEGEGSILSYLKKKGWANGMSAGAGNGASGFEFFKISVDLTKEGLDNHEDVCSVLFAYIDLLRTTPPSEWAFKEVAALSSLAFRYKEKSPPTTTSMHLALTMSRPFPREKLLSAPWKSTEWNPRIIRELVEERMRPEECRIMIASQEPVEGRTYELKEKWYGTEYTIVPISEKLLERKPASDFPGLALPKPNEFVPTDLEIKNKVEVEAPAKRPLSIRNNPTSRLWYKKDDRWWVPRAGAFILLRSPLVDDTALHSVQSRLFTELVKDALTEYSYDAELAGLSYTFETQGDGILLTVDGYNDKLHVLAKVVVEKMKELKVDEERLRLITDQLKRAYINYRLDQPYNHAAFYTGYLTSETAWTRDAQLAALEDVTPANLQSYIAEVLSRLHVEMLVHGNMLKDEAIGLSKLVENTFAPEPLTPEELRSHRALVVPEGKYLRRVPVGNPENSNSAIEQFTYIGDIYDDLERAKLSVFATIVQEPLFDDLRAKQQLGYIVSSGSRRSIAFMGLRVIVQSEKDAAFVESRVDAFWEEFKQTLDDMSEEEFDKYKTTVINKKLEDHKNMWEESSHLWLHIHAGWYDFEQRARDVPILQALTKKDIVDFFHRHFFASPSHPIRRLSIHMNSQRLQPEQVLALAPTIAQFNVPMDEAQLAAFVASRPTVEQVKGFATQFLDAAGKSQEEIERVLQVVDRLADQPTPEGVEVVEDVEAWKSKLIPAPYATPVAEYSDLISKV
ncbi:Metalloenzyme, LuxS/M16 peptidase-like protein [Leucosporidium creatinivorum]|uniref:Metalloenzyme, LuxS/M16 peptidase-like protein n=1 Tax=Leucosporidium creatinivorum TaxID=106004 RepID=A0A1Y2DB09_9BASI|nr:Metalloenzyme, LuxS/M16 peptidase-like protein [Leucosporidium creatinivorum]